VLQEPGTGVEQDLSHTSQQHHSLAHHRNEAGGSRPSTPVDEGAVMRCQTKVWMCCQTLLTMSGELRESK